MWFVNRLLLYHNFSMFYPIAMRCFISITDMNQKVYSRWIKPSRYYYYFYWYKYYHYYCYHHPQSLQIRWRLKLHNLKSIKVSKTEPASMSLAEMYQMQVHGGGFFRLWRENGFKCSKYFVIALSLRNLLIKLCITKSSGYDILRWVPPLNTLV